MKWNVIVRDITTGTIGPYNILTVQTSVLLSKE